MLTRSLLLFVLLLVTASCVEGPGGTFQDIPFGISCKDTVPYVKQHSPRFDAERNTVTYTILWHGREWFAAHECGSNDSLLEIKLLHLTPTGTEAQEYFEQLSSELSVLYGEPSFNQQLQEESRATGKRWSSSDFSVLVVQGFEGPRGFVVASIGPTYDHMRTPNQSLQPTQYPSLRSEHWAAELGR